MQVISTLVFAWDSLAVVLLAAVGETAAVAPSSVAGCSRAASVAELAWVVLPALASAGVAVGIEHCIEVPPSSPGSLPVAAVVAVAVVSSAPDGCISASAPVSSSAFAFAAWLSAVAALH